METRRFRRELVRFVLVGSANTVVHYLVYVGARLALPYVAAHVAAVVAAMMCSYLANCRFTFGVAPRLRTMLLFPLSNLTGLGISTAAACGLGGVGVDPGIASPSGGLLAVPATFVLNKVLLSRRGCRGAERGLA